MWSVCCGTPVLRGSHKAMTTARGHIRALAGAGRPAGSAAEREALDYCATLLRQHGFSVAEEPFEFSAAVGRWMVPTVSAVMAMAFGVVAVLILRGMGAAALIGLGFGALGLVLAGMGLMGARWGVLRWPTHRVQGVNLVATRGEPRVWLMAHVDTKSQPIPTLVRASCLVITAAAWAATTVGLWIGAIHPAVPLLGMMAALVASMSTVGNESPGAADNATGVATLLRVAQQLAVEKSLGVVITSGEELGLAGARHWVRARTPGKAINIDTVDDTGAWRCMVHGGGSSAWADAVAASAQELALKLSPVIPGLLTDGVALADAGWQVVTLSRGNLGTLGRIHRPSDSVGHLTGESTETLARTLVHSLDGLT